MITRRSERCLSNHVLDKLLAGELSGSDGDEAREHLGSCGPCSAQMEALSEEAARFRAEIPIEGEVRAVERKVRMRAVRHAAAAVLSLAAVLLLALLVIPPEPGVRTKGGLSLEVIARHENGAIEELLPGARLSPGDSIRFRIASEEGGFLAIAGLDSAQVVSIYHQPVRIESGAKERLLEGSIVLDQTLGPEQIAALVCPAPLDGAGVLAAGRAALDRAGGDPRRVSELDVGCEQAFFLIEKVAR
jgi:hypothetical protein